MKTKIVLCAIVFFIVLVAILQVANIRTIDNRRTDSTVSSVKEGLKSESTVFPNHGKSPELSDGSVERDHSSGSTLSVGVRLNPPKPDCPVRINVLGRDGVSVAEREITSTVQESRIDINSIESGVEYTIVVFSEGYISYREKAMVEGESCRVDVVLSEYPLLELKTENEDGDVVPGADVAIISHRGGFFATKFQTDGKGLASVQLPQPGDFSIQVSQALYAGVIEKSISVRFNPNRYTLVLSRKSGLIFGTITDHNKNPISGAEVALSRSSIHNIIFKTKADRDGRYAFRDVNLSRYYVHVDAGEQYLESDAAYTDGIKTDRLIQPVELTPEDSSHQVDFIVEPVLTIEGKVVDESGVPVPNALIVTGIQGQRATSVLPAGRRGRTGSQGEFIFPLRNRILEWTTLLVSATHPKYGYVTETIENFDWRTNLTDVTLVLSKSVGTLIGTVVDARTATPMTIDALKIVQYAYRNLDDFHTSLSPDENGRFEAELPEGEYLFTAEGYQIQSPDSIRIINNDTIETTVCIIKDDSPKMTVNGIVIDKDFAPIHGALIHIISSNRAFGGTETTPEGRFQFEMNVQDFQDDYEMTVYHPNYQMVTTVLGDITDPEGIVVQLREQPGAVKALLSGGTAVQGMNLYLVSAQTFQPVKTVECIEGTPVYVRNIDPKLGPFLILSGNSFFCGLSSVFDLNESITHYQEIEVLMVPQRTNGTLSFQLNDAKTSEPIPIVTGEIRGVTLNKAGLTSQIDKKTISGSDGIITFKNLPPFYGTIEFNHVFYNKKSLNFLFNGSSDLGNNVIVLESNHIKR